jgi:GMP synthase (glutamine-hydrolysing)
MHAESWTLSARAIENHDLAYRVHFPILHPKDLPSIRNCDAVIIPGSTFTPKKDFVRKTDWMKRLCEFIRKIAESEKPLLGICFGHEAIGAAYGVYPVKLDADVFAEAGFHEISVTSEGQKDILFKGMGRKLMALLLHYSYLPEMPINSKLLAENENCIQAFRMDENVWGVQFHPDYGLVNARRVVNGYRSTWPKIMQERDIDLDQDVSNNLAVLNNFLKFVKTT